MSNGSLDHLGILDDFGYDLADPTEDHSLLGTMFLVQATICFFFNSICVLYLIVARKYRQSAKYYMLTHYFTCKLLFTVVLSVSLLMSSVFEETKVHIPASRWLCKFEFFGNMFMETCENYLLFFLWLLLLSEREFVGCKYLNQDGLNLSEPTMADTSIRTWCRKNIRTIALGLFYGITGLLTLIFASDVDKVMFIGYKKGMCVTSSLASLPIFLLANYPLIFWLILFSTLLWKLFGGERDPILHKLSEADIMLLKFIKLASLLRALEVILVHTQVTFLQLFWKLDFKVVEFSRISGFFIIFCTSMLFMYFENLFAIIWSLDLNLIRRIRTAVGNRNEGEENQDQIIYANLIE